MKKILSVLILPILTITLMASLQSQNPLHSSLLASIENLQSDTTEFDRTEALEKLRKQIEGRENEPSGVVFENIQKFEQLPAARLLRVMEMGFSRSLGVECTHCHNPADWSSEEKVQKQIARDMMDMAAEINNNLLSKVEGLEGTPTVNCTTCHRGDVKPALNLP